MEAVVLVIHCLLALALVGVVLLQQSEGGALGIGGGNMGGMMTTRGTANFLTRATGILAAGFISTSLLLAILSGGKGHTESLVEKTAPATAPITAPAETPTPTTPTVPLSK